MNGHIIALIHLTNKVDYIFVVLVATMYTTLIIIII